MIGLIEPPCGVPAHRMGRWDNFVLGIWWCPDCREAIWVTEDADGHDASGAPTRAGAVGGSGSAADPVPRVPGDAAEPGHAPRTPRDRTPADAERVNQLHGRVWNRIFRTLGGGS